MSMTAVRTIRAPLMAFFAMGIFWGAWGALVPDVKATTGASDGELGLALLFVALGAVPAMLVGGRLSDRIGAPLLPASVAVFALAVALPGLAPSPAWLAAALFLVGLGSGLMDVAMNARVGAAEAATGMRSMHLAHGLFAVLYLLAAFATGMLRSIGATPSVVLAGAAVLLLVLAALARSKGHAPEAGTADGDDGGPTGSSVLRLPEGYVVLFGVIAFAAFLSENAWQSWSALHLERSFGAEPWLGSLGPATVGVAVAIGRLGGQALTGRVSDGAMLLGSAALAIAGALAFALAPSVAWAMPALFVAALGASVIAPTVLSLAGRTASASRRGTAVATVSVIAYTGFFVGPAVMGGLSEAHGLRAALGAVAAILVLVPIAWSLHAATRRGAPVASTEGAGGEAVVSRM